MSLLDLVSSENNIKIDLRQGLILACESMDDSNKESFSQSHLKCFVKDKLTFYSSDTSSYSQLLLVLATVED